MLWLETIVNAAAPAASARNFRREIPRGRCGWDGFNRSSITTFALHEIRVSAAGVSGLGKAVY
jgi:hypothetical protein